MKKYYHIAMDFIEKQIIDFGESLHKDWIGMIKILFGVICVLAIRDIMYFTLKYGSIANVPETIGTMWIWSNVISLYFVSKIDHYHDQKTMMSKA